MNLPQGWYREHDGSLVSWFAAASLTQAASLLPALLRDEAEGTSAEGPRVDLRDCGIRVRLPATQLAATHAAQITAAALDRGLAPDPSGATRLTFQVRTAQPEAIATFWTVALGYRHQDGRLVDPLHRWPDVEIQPVEKVGARRQRVHVDASHPRSLPAAADPLGPAGGTTRVANDWYRTIADPERNEVDIVPGQPLGDDPDTSDWWVIFGAVTRYLTPDTATAVQLMSTVAQACEEAGIPLLIDLREGSVVLDTGKDRWEVEGFPALAARVQACARDLGLRAEVTPLQFVQTGIDGQDITALRQFWCAVLGYEHAPNEQISDIVDPRWLLPPMIFQGIDTSETERLAQPNRWVYRVTGPAPVIDARVQLAQSLPGVVVHHGAGDEGGWTVLDDEGNEIVLRPFA